MRIYINYLCIVNIIVFILYGVDKLFAKISFTRIPEKILLNFAIFGGAYGSFIGMYLFHHKTKKKLFIRVNYFCLIIYTIFNYILWRNLWV